MHDGVTPGRCSVGICKAKFPRYLATEGLQGLRSGRERGRKELRSGREGGRKELISR
jgi:hypothetical protein